MPRALRCWMLAAAPIVLRPADADAGLRSGRAAKYSRLTFRMRLASLCFGLVLSLAAFAIYASTAMAEPTFSSATFQRASSDRVLFGDQTVGSTSQTAPQGDWTGTYGSDGYVLAGWNASSDLVALPGGIGETLQQGSRHTWTSSTTDPRALESPDGTSRRATAYYGSQIEVQLSFSSAYEGNLHLYAVAWNGQQRPETITVNDGSSSQTVPITTGLKQGVWVTVPINVASNGTVSITVSSEAGTWAVLSGIMLGDGGPPFGSGSVPANTAAPVISGTATQGSTLTTSNGSWAGSPTSYAYQWQRCAGASCSNISGATSASYSVQSADVGDTIDVVVTASNAAGSTSQTSAQTAAVSAGSGSSAPASTSAPVVHGYTTPGSEVMANDPGSWTNSPTSFTYQWQDCKSGSCSNATNTTGLSGDPCSPTAFCYVVSSAEANAEDTIQVTVTAHNASGTGQATAQASQAASSSEPVNCARTQAAGRDGGGDSNDGSCWGQHTGVTGATGCTEAQLLARSPAMCGSPYFSTVTSDQNFTSANQALVNKVVEGCVGVQSGANNFQTRDVLIHTTDWSCQNNSSDSSPGAWGDGNDQNVPSAVVIRDTEVDDPHGTLEQSGDADDFGIVIGAGGLAQRVNTHGWSKDITVDGTSSAPMTVEDSFIHDPAAPQNDVADCQGASSPGPHEDPFWGDSASYVTAEHDYVSAAGGGDCATAALAFLSDWGAPTHDTIDNTFMEGGSAPGDGRPDAYFGKSGTCAFDTTVTNDAFSSDTGSLAQIEEWNPSNTGNSWSGNVTPETGATVAAPNSCN